MVYVETGSLYGDGILNAVQSECFSAFFSIDISPRLVEHTKLRWKDREEVKVYCGDSAGLLSSVLRESMIVGPTFCFLDAHGNWGGDVPPSSCPLNEEVRIVLEKLPPIVAVDDLRLMGELGINRTEMERLLSERYDLSIADGHYAKDILVGYLRSQQDV